MAGTRYMTKHDERNEKTRRSNLNPNKWHVHKQKKFFPRPRVKPQPLPGCLALFVSECSPTELRVTRYFYAYYVCIVWILASSMHTVLWNPVADLTTTTTTYYYSRVCVVHDVYA